MSKVHHGWMGPPVLLAYGASGRTRTLQLAVLAWNKLLMRSDDSLPLLGRDHSPRQGAIGEKLPVFLEPLSLWAGGGWDGGSRLWLKYHRLVTVLTIVDFLGGKKKISSFALCLEENFYRFKMVIFLIIFFSCGCFAGEGASMEHCRHLSIWSSQRGQIYERRWCSFPA